MSDNTPQDLLDGMIDKFLESDTLVLSIKTPSREVISQLISECLGVRDSTLPFEPIGLSFDVELVRTADYEVIANALNSLNSLVQLSIDKTSLQLN